MAPVLPCLCKLPAWQLACTQWILLLLVRTNVERIQLLQRQLEELMFVRPSSLSLCELVTVCRRRRWVCYFRNQVRSRCFGNTINEDTEQGNFEEDVESHPESEEQTFPIVEPTALLLLGEADACEVRLELCSYEVSTGALYYNMTHDHSTGPGCCSDWLYRTNEVRSQERP